jgi:UDP-N-acetyl-D-mannosaminuronate dehydrogenase
MKLTVFGASGGTGTHVISQALNAGREVVAVVCEPARLRVAAHPNLDVTVAEVMDPAVIADLVAGLALHETRVLVLGVAYKKDVGDVRESPSMQVTEELVRLGAEVRCADPHVAPADLPTGCMPVPARTALAEAQKVDVVLLQVDHDAFELREIAQAAKRMLDCRYTVTGRRVEHL